MSRRRRHMPKKRAPKLFLCLFLFLISTIIVGSLAMASWFLCVNYLEATMPMIKYCMLAFFGTYLISLFSTYVDTEYEMYASVYIANCLEYAMINLLQFLLFFSLVIGCMVYYYLK